MTPRQADQERVRRTLHLGLLDEAEPEAKTARELNPDNRVEAMDDAIGYLSQVQHLSDSLIARYLLGQR